MPGLNYPVDYIVDVERDFVSTRNQAEAMRALGAFQQIAAEAHSRYQGEHGELSPEQFEEVTNVVLGAVAFNRGDTADIRVRNCLAEIEGDPSDRDIITWKTRERMRGYMYQFEVCVDLAGNVIADSEIPLVVMMFYSIRSEDIISYEEALEETLSDFAEGAAPGGPYEGQDIYGALCTGVYEFNP